MKKLGKSSKKGFTLVELIVVLVILAVLAAMLVPALVGYIDKAKAEKEFQTASTIYAAAQAVTTEAYGKNHIDATATTLTDTAGFNKTVTGVTDTVNKAYGAEVYTLAGVTQGTTGSTKDSFSFTISNYIITGGSVVIGGHTYTLTIDATTGAPSWSAV